MPPYSVPRSYPVYVTAHEAESARRFLAVALKKTPPELKEYQDGAVACFAKLTHVVDLDAETLKPE